MMKIYCLNEEACYAPGEADEQFDHYEWLVYDYWDQDGYSGDGEGVALGKDGLLYVYNLGHCSCYGPFDSFGSHDGGITVEKYLETENDATDPFNQKVRDKVKKLMKL